MAFKVAGTSSGAGFIPSKDEEPERTHSSADIDALRLIEDYNLSFNRGQSLRLVATAGDYNKYGLVDDLLMARFFLDREIARLQKAPKGEKVIEGGKERAKEGDNPG